MVAQSSEPVRRVGVGEQAGGGGVVGEGDVLRPDRPAQHLTERGGDLVQRGLPGRGELEGPADKVRCTEGEGGDLGDVAVVHVGHRHLGAERVGEDAVGEDAVPTGEQETVHEPGGLQHGELQPAGVEPGLGPLLRGVVDQLAQ